MAEFFLDNQETALTILVLPDNNIHNHRPDAINVLELFFEYVRGRLQNSWFIGGHTGSGEINSVALRLQSLCKFIKVSRLGLHSTRGESTSNA